ncbi:MAG: GGDEF domain-containing protein [Planctomycetes bacterium]|nr:GGDEF domain-containing protein [Planctomycetota bacterium]MBI3832772.1 GGDEF domain-containing protein [Planctomycetota bacterium]
MSIAQLLPWFPIILGVGVGGRLLGRPRGLVLGGVCALFWIVLIQASSGTRVWSDGWTVWAIILGAIAITLMGGWAGPSASESRQHGNRPISGIQSIVGGSFFHPFSARGSPKRSSRGRNAIDGDPTIDSHAADDGVGRETSQCVNLLDRITAACRRFDDWINEHRDSLDLWPAFGEFIREVLFQTCRATHVKPYRMQADSGGWVPLRDAENSGANENPLPHLIIVDHVLAMRRSYVSVAAGHENAESGSASGDRQSRQSLAWCFAIRSGEACLGLVTVGRLDASPAPPKALLDSIEQIVGQFWRTVAEASANRSAEKQDAASGLLNRSSFIQQAKIALRESELQAEPAAVAMIAIHGLRELNDNGKWEIADELIHEVGSSLREKVRLDDRFGRFDGSRFVWLLRRVDSELANLIVRQVVTRLTVLCGDRQRWQASIAVRCGLVGGDLKASDIRTLVSQALVQSRRARTEGITVATDLHGTRDLAAAGAIE